MAQDDLLRDGRASVTASAWYDPQTIAKVAEVVGIDLVSAMPFEVPQINISVKDQNEEYPGMDKTSYVAWHYDSFPFVCVTMASDCRDMVGGETAIELPNGGVQKVQGPSTVCIPLTWVCNNPLR